MSQLFKNNAKTRLESAIAISDTSFTVVSGGGADFPVLSINDHMLITLEDSSGNKEIVKVIARVGDVFTIGTDPGGAASVLGRAQDGTTAQGFSAQDIVELRLTAGFIDALKEGSITFVIDGGGIDITTGIKGFIEAPFSGTITNVKLFADLSGDIEIDIYKDTFDNYDPTVNPTDSICANSTNPIIMTGQIKQIADLTGWTRQFAKGDIFYFGVNSATTVTRVTIAITVDRY